MLGRLTPRETDVLKLLCAGRTDEEAGAELGITAASIRHHTRAIQTGLRERSIAALCRQLAPLPSRGPSPKR